MDYVQLYLFGMCLTFIYEMILFGFDSLSPQEEEAGIRFAAVLITSAGWWAFWGVFIIEKFFQFLDGLLIEPLSEEVTRNPFDRQNLLIQQSENENHVN